MMLLVVTMAMSTPLGAKAASVVKEDTTYVTCYPKTKVYSNKQKIQHSATAKFTALKSSKQSVATVSCKKEKDGYKIYVNAKKVGTTKVSYKLKGVTHTQKVVVKKYTNPYKKVTVNGKDITAQFKKSNVAVVSYKKYKNKKVIIKYEMKKDWAPTHSDYCKGDKILKCIGSLKYEFSINKPKKSSTVETAIITYKDDNVDQSSVIIFK